METITMRHKRRFQQRLLFLQFLAIVEVVDDDFSDLWLMSKRFLPTTSVISTTESTYHRDEVLRRQLPEQRIYNIGYGIIKTPHLFISFLANLLSFCWRFFLFHSMADNIRRAFQDIDLGINDAPFVLPPEIVRQAEEENRFILIGRPVMPRRQNLRAIIATMPRNWGLEGLARGRIIEQRRFQFVFPSEEAMETVIRRGPWAFADRMLVLQRWTPLMDLALLDFIPFWIQIRGIPFQYMNREVIVSIARTMGQYIQMDYNEENGSRLDFVRVRINWNIINPLRFQRNYQFVLGINTTLRFQYERLRGFCELCGMLTHDSGACVINNGGPGQADEDDDDDDDDDSGEDNEAPELVPNQGVIIEEVNDEEEHHDDAEDGGNEQEANEETVQDDMEEEEKEDELWNGSGMRTMFTDEAITEEMYNPIDPFGIKTDREVGIKRKAWMSEANGNTARLTNAERGETSGTRNTKRSKVLYPINGTQSENEEDSEPENSSGLGGAVGPEPPLPP
ncbi:uncharacterized protein LOC106392677 [Brassica napus]|uniref:uncharacterized protein LOC106392677 n=1 Tax=Brassica napus TaxID=3708 RepID=UPI002079ED78|nr:uncharacterized protein LOC106392677 [Brassica napus]